LDAAQSFSGEEQSCTSACTTSIFWVSDAGIVGMHITGDEADLILVRMQGVVEDVLED
jgi:hypothetical protein